MNEIIKNEDTVIDFRITVSSFLRFNEYPWYFFSRSAEDQILLPQVLYQAVPQHGLRFPQLFFPFRKSADRQLSKAD